MLQKSEQQMVFTHIFGVQSLLLYFFGFFNPLFALLNNSLKRMVGVMRIELVTSSMSNKFTFIISLIIFPIYHLAGTIFLSF